MLLTLQRAETLRGVPTLLAGGRPQGPSESAGPDEARDFSADQLPGDVAAAGLGPSPV